MRSSVVISALVAVLVGFGGSVAVVLAAAEAVGASRAETSSWIAVLCVSMMATSAVLSLWHRMPIVTAWSTPGAALIATTEGITLPMAVGAFLFCAILILLTAAIRPLGRLVQAIPTPIATAILAGVLFPFVVATVGGVAELPFLGIPMVFAFVLIRLASPAWAVVAVLGLGIGLSYTLELTTPAAGFALSDVVWIVPEFDLATLIGLGLPLYLVTMASQNLPGFAVLRAAGYAPPTQSILAVTGLASLLSAGAAAHTTSAAAITASICTGPDTHPDKEKRWLAGPFYAIGYALLAIGGASVVALFESFPAELVVIVAGIALTGPFVNAAAAAFPKDGDPLPAAAAFIVTASGVAFLGIGSAFWGLAVGLLLTGIDRRRAPA
ncbi:MAG: benzoate/H(+) symporter BenE family transporter [Alphaproteobacteria bacterium]|nr:benzoate/H(+) symporter BenE family transporter [Alphaproteobacteria bacterium]